MKQPKETVTRVDALKNLEKLTEEFARSIVNTFPKAQGSGRSFEGT